MDRLSSQVINDQKLVVSQIQSQLTYWQDIVASRTGSAAMSYYNNNVSALQATLTHEQNKLTQMQTWVATPNTDKTVNINTI